MKKLLFLLCTESAFASVNPPAHQTELQPDYTTALNTLGASSLEKFIETFDEQKFLDLHPDFRLSFDLADRSLTKDSATWVKRYMILKESFGEELWLADAIFSSVLRNLGCRRQPPFSLENAFTFLGKRHSKLQKQMVFGQHINLRTSFQLRQASPDLIRQTVFHFLLGQAQINKVEVSQAEDLTNLSDKALLTLWENTRDRLDDLLTKLSEPLELTFIKSPLPRRNSFDAAQKPISFMSPTLTRQEWLDAAKDYTQKNTSPHPHEQDILNFLNNIEGSLPLNHVVIFDSQVSIQNAHIPEKLRDEYLNAANDSDPASAIRLVRDFFFRLCAIETSGRKKAKTAKKKIFEFFESGLKDPFLKPAILAFMAKAESPQSAIDRADELLRELSSVLYDNGCYRPIFGNSLSCKQGFLFRAEKGAAASQDLSAPHITFPFSDQAPLPLLSFNSSGNLSWLFHSPRAIFFHEVFHGLDSYTSANIYRLLSINQGPLKYDFVPGDIALKDYAQIVEQEKNITDSVEPTFSVLSALFPLRVDPSRLSEAIKLELPLEGLHEVFPQLNDTACWFLHSLFYRSTNEVWQILGFRVFVNPDTQELTLVINPYSDASIALHKGTAFRQEHLDSSDRYGIYPDPTFGQNRSCLCLDKATGPKGEVSSTEILCRIHQVDPTEYQRKLEANQNTKDLYMFEVHK